MAGGAAAADLHGLLGRAERVDGGGVDFSLVLVSLEVVFGLVDVGLVLLEDGHG